MRKKLSKREQKKRRSNLNLLQFEALDQNVWVKSMTWAAFGALTILAISRCSPITPSVLKQAYEEQKTVGEISNRTDSLFGSQLLKTSSLEDQVSITFEVAEFLDELETKLEGRTQEKGISLGRERVDKFRLEGEVEISEGEFDEVKERVKEIIFFVDVSSEREIQDYHLDELPLEVSSLFGRGYSIRMKDKGRDPLAEKTLKNTLIDIVMILEERPNKDQDLVQDFAID